MRPTLRAAFPPQPKRRRTGVCLLPALLLLLGLAFAPPAAAQIREGLYEVEGQNPDGTTYQGSSRCRPGQRPAGWQPGRSAACGSSVSA